MNNTTSATGNILTTFTSPDSSKRIDELKKLASKPDTDFTVSSPKTQRNIFHKTSTEHAIHRLTAVRTGLSELTTSNPTVEAVSSPNCLTIHPPKRVGKIAHNMLWSKRLRFMRPNLVQTPVKMYKVEIIDRKVKCAEVN